MRMRCFLPSTLGSNKFSAEELPKLDLRNAFLFHSFINFPYITLFIVSTFFSNISAFLFNVSCAILLVLHVFSTFSEKNFSKKKVRMK